MQASRLAFLFLSVQFSRQENPGQVDDTAARFATRRERRTRVIEMIY